MAQIGCFIISPVNNKADIAVLAALANFHYHSYIITEKVHIFIFLIF